MRLKIVYDGRTFAPVTAEQAAVAGIPADVIAAAVTAAQWQAIRTRRDRLLSASDWTQMPDSPLNDAQKAEWQTYRQALRDLPESVGDADAVTWPTPPAA